MNIFNISIANKGLIFNIYKQPTQLHVKKKKQKQKNRQPNQTMGSRSK